MSFCAQSSEILFLEDELRELQIFSENFGEFKKSLLSFPKIEKIPEAGAKRIKLQHIETKTEFASYLVLFRKIYSCSNDEPGNFSAVCNIFIKYSETRLALLAEDALQYFDQQKANEIKTFNEFSINRVLEKEFGVLLKKYSEQLKVSDFIDLVFYTGNLHNPKKLKIERLNKLRKFLNRPDADEIISLLSSFCLISFQQLFCNVGQLFVEAYIATNETKSTEKFSQLSRQGLTADQHEKKTVFNKYVRILAESLWREAALPQSSPYAFENIAGKIILENLGSDYSWLFDNV